MTIIGALTEVLKLQLPPLQTTLNYLKLFTRKQSGFQLSVESNSRLLWFCFITLSGWLAKLMELLRPIRSKTQNSYNRDSLARVFPRLAPVACICFEF